MLSNIVLQPFDEKIFEYCRSMNIRYTRYADDIFVSGGNLRPGDIIRFIRTELKKFGLSLNEKKTAIMRDGTRKVVTGIVVNEKLSVPKSYRRKIRQECFYIRKYGLEGHIQRSSITEKNYLYHLIGKINFCLSIDNDDEMKDNLRYMTSLLRLAKSESI